MPKRARGKFSPNAGVPGSAGSTTETAYPPSSTEWAILEMRFLF